MNASVPGANLSAFERFPPLSLLLLIFFSVATLGIYTWWWMYSRSILLNEALPVEQRIDTNLMHLCLGGFFVTLVLAVAAGLQPDNISLENTVNILSMALNIMVIVWILYFRRGMNYLLGQTRTQYHLNIVWTLLFQVFYMQYKINMIRAHNQIGVM
jgi:hypothetical protein